ncbi:MAG TPA: FAD-dependent oxidoreductase [Candidatus Paceibacterota bacterium]
MYDLAIIGGGPAGVAAGVYASRKRLKTVFITKDWESQSTVSEGIENWIGTVKIAGSDFAKSLEGHLRAYAADIVDIKTGEYCKKVSKIGGADDAGFEIATETATYRAKTVLIATGSRRRKLDVPGADVFEHKGITYCASCDGPVFAGQDVAVIGGGNAAFESAAQLLAYCKSVTLLNRSEEFRADPVTVKKVLQNPKMRAITNAKLAKVKGGKFVKSLTYTNESGETIELPVSGIFAEIGSIPATDFAKDLVTIDPFGRVVVDARTQATSVPGVWAAGDCTDGLYHQNNIAAGDAVKALEDIYVYIHAK